MVNGKKKRSKLRKDTSVQDKVDVSEHENEINK